MSAATPRRNGADNPPAPFPACAVTRGGGSFVGCHTEPAELLPLHGAQLRPGVCPALLREPFPEVVVFEEDTRLDVGEGSAGFGVDEDPVVALPAEWPGAVPVLIDGPGGGVRAPGGGAGGSALPAYASGRTAEQYRSWVRERYRVRYGGPGCGRGDDVCRGGVAEQFGGVDQQPVSRSERADPGGRGRQRQRTLSWAVHSRRRGPRLFRSLERGACGRSVPARLLWLPARQGDDAPAQIPGGAVKLSDCRTRQVQWNR